MADKRANESNIFLDHPGVVATFVALVILGTFVGALYNTAGEHEGAEPSAEHSAAPGASGAHPATSAATPPATSAAH